MGYKDMWVTYGDVTVIETKRKNRPAGLRKPYEYVLSLKDADLFITELRFATKALENQGFQFGGVTRKGLTRGYKVDFFLLGYEPDSGDTDGVSRKQWEEVTTLVQSILTKYLGPDAEAYIEPYSSSEKFQARWEAYVMYKEFLD